MESILVITFKKQWIAIKYNYYIELSGQNLVTIDFSKPSF